MKIRWLSTEENTFRETITPRMLTKDDTLGALTHSLSSRSLVRFPVGVVIPYA